MAQIGKWAFIAGLVIAVIAGLGIEQLQFAWLGWVLAALGLVVGFLNVGSKETHSFLLSAIGLVVCATAVSTIPYVGGYVTAIISNVIAFISAAVLVVALKILFETARS